MTSLDVTQRQADRLFVSVSRQLDYAHRLHARCVELGYPADDPLMRAARNAVLALRELYLAVNDCRAETSQWRAKTWAAV